MDTKARYTSLFLIIFLLSTFIACKKNISEEEQTRLRQQNEIKEANNKNDKNIKYLEVEDSERRIQQNVYLQGIDVSGLSEEEALGIIKERAAKLEKKSEDAKFNAKTWTITPGKNGIKVDVSKTLRKLMNAESGEDVKLSVQEVTPKKTESSYKKSILVIAKASTPLVDNSKSRLNNIELAIEKINNTIMEPDEEFSFNRVVGNRTEEKGYENAPIIIKTEEGPKKKDGIGGGVCQLSTTIYNAVEDCGLEVTERHAHSSDVTYADEGEDAAVSYGHIDLKFINNRKYPIMIKVTMDTKQLTVTILENKIE